MKLEDKKQIQIAETGDDTTRFVTESGLLISEGYKRVVFGGRGAYVEFNPTNIIHTNIHIPENQLFRLSDPRIYYIEFRSCDDSLIKVYYQMRTVAYADYKIGQFYICPTQLKIQGGSHVLTRSTENERSVDFFE
jgi:hypothetical protein